MNDLNLTVTEERVKDTPLEVFYMLDSGAPKVMIDYIAHFVTDENGNYLPQDEAVARVVKGRTVRDLESIASDLREAVERGVVPNK